MIEENRFLSSHRELIELDGRRRVFDLRDTWSTWIIIWISFLITTHLSLAFFVGNGFLNFQHHIWLVSSLITENFLEIVGMGLIVVKFLYPNSIEMI